MEQPTTLSRRRILGASGTALTLGLAGCTTSTTPAEDATSTKDTPDFTTAGNDDTTGLSAGTSDTLFERVEVVDTQIVAKINTGFDHYDDIESIRYIDGNGKARAQEYGFNRGDVRKWELGSEDYGYYYGAGDQRLVATNSFDETLAEYTFDYTPRVKVKWMAPLGNAPQKPAAEFDEEHASSTIIVFEWENVGTGPVTLLELTATALEETAYGFGSHYSKNSSTGIGGVQTLQPGESGIAYVGDVVAPKSNKDQLSCGGAKASGELVFHSYGKNTYTFDMSARTGGSMEGIDGVGYSASYYCTEMEFVVSGDSAKPGEV